MKLGVVMIQVLSAICFAITSSLGSSLSMPGCQEKCGNLTIPFPFGVGAGCSANSSFAVICQNSTAPPKPFLSSINLEILSISLNGTVTVNLPVSPINCSDGRPRTESLPVSLEGGPFSVSAHHNSLLVTGCNTSLWLLTDATTVAACTAVCGPGSTDTSCSGVNCCQVAFPRRLQEVQYTYQSFQTGNGSYCGYVVTADKKWLRNEGRVGDDPFDRGVGFAPLVLEWEFGTQTYLYSNYSVCGYPHDYNLTNRGERGGGYSRIIYPAAFCRGIHDYDRCESLLSEFDYEYRYSFYYSEHDYVSSIRYCSCRSGFEGNPYIVEGCSDIDECSSPELNVCNANCKNRVGGYECGLIFGVDRSKRLLNGVKIASIVVGSVVGGLILLVGAWKFGKAVAEAIKAFRASRKHMFFKRNGGILLEQQLAAFENGIEKTKLFSSVELAKATDDYNENRVLGRGGEGVVYKGMLEDGRIVAVKKSERVSQGDVEDFINEVVIVSQINHRNVVKLLGCCLESEVPRLVYEFVPNGTLFSHIHHPHDDFPLFWEMRVRIAKQVAGALAYLHSSASVPIYHRDIKSTNILLDEKYRAKISDFGTSRSISIDQTHVTTRVVGTFGYLDPEYFQSNQFTEKSDVYSFGVVLVELITGEKAISAVRVEEGRGLAMHFLHSMEEGQLFHIVDARVLKEGKVEDIIAMAAIAKRCLHLNGKGRPTMREVARDLDAIQVEKQEPESLQCRIQSSSSISNNSSFSSVEDDDFCSVSETIELSSSHEP